MINLLFNCTTKFNQNFMSLKTKPKVIELVLFEVNYGYSKIEAETALASLNDVLKLYYGFIERITASNVDGKYVDILYWSDMKSAKEASDKIMKNEKALEAFNVIKPESVQMYHFDAFNQFEE